MTQNRQESESGKETHTSLSASNHDRHELYHLESDRRRRAGVHTGREVDRTEEPVTMTLTAVLFVRGESRCMGRDKATLMIAGKHLWSRQLDTLRDLQPDQILVSSRFRPRWSPAEIDIVFDEPPSPGPLSRMTAALKRIRKSLNECNGDLSATMKPDSASSPVAHHRGTTCSSGQRMFPPASTLPKIATNFPRSQQFR
jgi:hypothetical protein